MREFLLPLLCFLLELGIPELTQLHRQREMQRKQSRPFPWLSMPCPLLLPVAWSSKKNLLLLFFSQVWSQIQVQPAYSIYLGSLATWLAGSKTRWWQAILPSFVAGWGNYHNGEPFCSVGPRGLPQQAATATYPETSWAVISFYFFFCFHQNYPTWQSSVMLISHSNDAWWYRGRMAFPNRKLPIMQPLAIW